MYIASTEPNKVGQRLHLTSENTTFYDKNGDQRLNLNITNGVTVGRPDKGRVQITDDAIKIYNNSNKERVRVNDTGFHVYNNDGVETAWIGQDAAQLGTAYNSDGATFLMGKDSLSAYANNYNYFYVSKNGMYYGSGTNTHWMATQTYANTAANTAVTNRDKAQYGECSTTAAGTADKIVACESFLSSMLIEGIRITVKFTNANTATTPALIVGGAAKKSIYYNGKVGSATNPIY